MTTFDFAPLYRSAIGFDNLASLLDSVASNDRSNSSYPPYNIELLDEDNYRITMAVAGFMEDEITVEVESSSLTIAATRNKEEGQEPKYLHQGIAERNFRRQFRLAEHIKVNGASMENGLLHIDLVREVPEAMKPRQITINNKTQPLLKSA